MRCRRFLTNPARPATRTNEPRTGHPHCCELFVYDGLQDEVALDCFRRALSGEQQQADLEIRSADGELVERRSQSVTLSLEVDEGEEPPTAEQLLDGEPFTIVRTVGGLDGTVRLVAEWSDGTGVLAAF